MSAADHITVDLGPHGSTTVDCSCGVEFIIGPNGVIGNTFHCCPVCGRLYFVRDAGGAT